MPQVLGLIRLFQNGTEIVIEEGGSLTLGGVVDDPVIAGTQVFAASHMEASEVQVKAIIPAGMVVTQAFPRGVDLAISVECDTGQTFSWNAMRIKGATKITVGKESSIDLNYFGGIWQETSASTTSS